MRGLAGALLLGIASLGGLAGCGVDAVTPDGPAGMDMDISPPPQDLSLADLAGVDLSVAPADLSTAPQDLSLADLAGVDLSVAPQDLILADLAGVDQSVPPQDLILADLAGADLSMKLPDMQMSPAEGGIQLDMSVQPDLLLGKVCKFTVDNFNNGCVLQ